MQQVPRAPSMQLCVILRRFNPVDVLHVNEDRLAGGAHGQTLQRAMRGCDSFEQRQNLTTGIIPRVGIKASLRASQSLSKPLLRHRLQQVINSINLKSLNRVLVMCRDEDHLRHLFCSDFSHYREPVHLWHLDIQEDEVWLNS